MRLAGATLLCLIAALPAFAQAQKPAKGQKATRVAPTSAAYATVPLPERIAIQNDLIWVGAYNGTATGEFGERAVAAVKAFQKESDVKETGVLNPQERAALAAAAKAKQDAVGWRIVDDMATGARLGLPGKLVPQTTPAKSGTRFTSARGEVQVETFKIAEPATTLPTVFEQQKKEPANRKVEYNVLRPDFFVISGLQGLKKFYVRAHARDGEVRGVTILYDQAMDGIMDPVVVAMSSAFVPYPAGSLAGPPPRRKVEYATGIVVAASGHVITDREATDACYVITIAGLGHAERIAEDATGLALLRVYGAPEAHPAALADAAPIATDVTLIGMPDPQGQSSASGVTAARARLAAAWGGAARLLEPAPAAGFSGAAALDREGRPVGMVRLKAPAVAGPASAGSQAVMVSGEMIKNFLEREKVALPAVGSPSLEAAKAAITRVICVRK